VCVGKRSNLPTGENSAKDNAREDADPHTLVAAYSHPKYDLGLPALGAVASCDKQAHADLRECPQLMHVFSCKSTSGSLRADRPSIVL
jgi:hypothetical protein